MKLNALLLLLSVAFTQTLMGQESIQFAEGNWEQLLAKAKNEKKLIFLDAYAEWCMPCKMMEANVFTDKEIAGFFNANFVNARIDMEKGEGPQLSEQFKIVAYPSLLFVNSEGEIVHRGVGYYDSEQFSELAETALDDNRNLLGMARKYEGGERSAEFLMQYAMTCIQAMDERGAEIADTYLKTQSDWGTPENMEFIFNLVGKVDSKMFDYLLEKRQAFEAQFGQEAVMEKIQNLIVEAAFSDTEDPEASFSKMEALYKRAYPEVADQMTAQFKLNYYDYIGDFDNYARTAVDYYNKYPAEDPSELNNIAWQFVEKTDDRQLLTQALKWAERSVEMDNQYYNNDTVAWLYFKLGDKAKAKKAAKKALAIAKKNGEDDSSTRELMKKF